MEDLVFQSFDDIFIIDDKKAAEGVWIQLGQNRYGQPILLKIRYYESEQCLAQVRKVATQLEKTRHDDKAKAKVWAKVMAKGVVLDWQNVLDGKGDEIPFSKKVAETALVRYEKLLLEVMRESQNRANFRADDVDQPDVDPAEDTEKN